MVFIFSSRRKNFEVRTVYGVTRTRGTYNTTSSGYPFTRGFRD